MQRLGVGVALKKGHGRVILALKNHGHHVRCMKAGCGGAMYGGTQRLGEWVWP